MDNLWIGLTIGICTSVVGGLILHGLLNRERDSRLRVKVYDLSNANGKKQFYVRLQRAFDGARSQVVQYAEGFGTELPEQFQNAKTYVDGMRRTLRLQPDVRWMRIQTKNPHDAQWDALLQGLLNEYPNQFRLFLFDNRPGDHVFSVVLVDPNTKKNTVVLLLSKRDHIGGKEPTFTAHMAVVIRGSTLLSKTLYDRLTVFRDPKSRYTTTIDPETH